MVAPVQTLNPVSRRRHKPDLRAYALISPFVGLVGMSLLLPIGFAIYLAFTNIDLIGPTSTNYSYTGTANIHRALSDPVFVHSLIITLIFSIGGTVVLQTPIGTAISLLLRRVPAYIRTPVVGVTVVAWVVPEVVIGLAWYAMAQPGGVLDQIFRSQSDLLLHQALLIVVAANIWHNIAFTVLVVSAGLLAIPTQVVEAAQVDGASPWVTFRYIKLPLLRATLATAVVLSVLQSLSVFTLIYVMTQGGPSNATMTLPVYVYQQGFSNNFLGYGTMMALALLVIGALLAVVMVRQIATTEEQ